MPKTKTNRREFLRRSVLAGVALSATTAPGQSEVLGANEKIRLGLIGCGSRGRWAMTNMVKPADVNMELVAISDVWKLRLESYPTEAFELLGTRPQAYADYRKLLEEKSIDAVLIATPAHQHCGQVIDAAQAGKHIYVEKPIAPLMESLEPLNECHDVVKKSGVVIQHGTQGSSAREVFALRDFFSTGEMGKIFRVESTINHYAPYWNYYKGPQKESETDWKAFLYGKPYRPFNADQHGAWMGYQDFSSGPICGWMSHFSNFVHAVTGCDFPVAATAFGGVYAPTSDRRRTAPDNVTVVLEYREGFYTQFVTHFGSSVGNETTLFMLDKGLVRTAFGHFPGNPLYSSQGVNQAIPDKKLLVEDPEYPGKAHIINWANAIRTAAATNADMDVGYKQGVAVVMGDTAYRLGKRVLFDKEKRTIAPA